MVLPILFFIFFFYFFFFFILFFFFFNDTATTEIYTFPYTTLFRSYTSTSISYNANDTYDDAMYKLMSNLDLDGDGRVDINLVKNNLVVNAISVHKVPYPWGPAIAEVRVWQ